ARPITTHLCQLTLALAVHYAVPIRHHHVCRPAHREAVRKPRRYRHLRLRAHVLADGALHVVADQRADLCRRGPFVIRLTRRADHHVPHVLAAVAELAGTQPDLVGALAGVRLAFAGVGGLVSAWHRAAPWCSSTW